ncbi:MAG: hypothetical protein JW974_01460 [Alphaproteobacteria bacterium]|nr:hypothetical protein [Alphaproteobacteria bacterium]MBN2675450.1 hypothetical protein [Alphaproteobacteria bacterium]
MNNTNQILEKKLAMLFANPPAQLNEKKLSPEDKKPIEKGVGDLFFGLAWTNWINGSSLGSAWQKALNQVDSFIATKTQNNPATKYLREVAAVGKSRMSRIIMTNQNSNEKIDCPPEKIKEWSEIGSKWTSQGLQSLNDKVKEFEPEKKEFAIQNNQQRFQNSQQNIMALWLLQRQRAA